MIADINWDSFKAKFYEDKSGAFERLCYLLFCKEHGKHTGIFRFKNHAGIETNPISVGEDVIGWQAKFYETRLAENTSDLKGSIDKTKSNHPSITKIIFYTNQEFGQNNEGSEPNYKTEIDDYGRDKGVELEWRMASYFESPFVCEENCSIAQYFFSQSKGVIDAIKELQKNTDTLLDPIRSEIHFGSEKIKIDRSNLVADICDKAEASPVLVLSGEAGVGKTAVIKDFYCNSIESDPIYIFKAIRFQNLTYINQLFNDFGEITASEFIGEHRDIEKKYLIIDSAEKLSDIEDHEVFRLFLSELIGEDWKVIFTVRYSYLDDLRFQLNEFFGSNFISLNVPALSIGELDRLASDFGFDIPGMQKLADLLAIPFYLSEYLQSYSNDSEDISYSEFRNRNWRTQIQNSAYKSGNMHTRRERCFLEIAVKRAKRGGFIVRTDDLDQDAVRALEASEIITLDNSAGGHFITHDIYEEWALDMYIERSFSDSADFLSFYEDIGETLPIRRAFRKWLSEKLFEKNSDVKTLIEYTLGDKSKLKTYWKDEVIVSVLLSNYSEKFFELFEKELLEVTENVEIGTNRTLLVRVLFLLRIACRTVDDDFLTRMGIAKTRASSLKTIFTTPKGEGWRSTIAFINKHKQALQLDHINFILPILDDWNKQIGDGATKRHASQIALFYLNSLLEQQGYYFSSRDKNKEQLFRTILNGTIEIKDELRATIGKSLEELSASRRNDYREFVKVILGSVIESSVIAENLPDEVLKLAKSYWPVAETESTNRIDDVEQYFGLSDTFEYYPSSAFQTPIWRLLIADPKSTIDFILSLTNESIEYLSKSELGDELEETDVDVDDSGGKVKQYISNRVWNIYRGTQVAPPLLESIHMALEKWLLEVAGEENQEGVEEWCLYLIENSRSASITAIVVSVVLANPSKLFSVAAILFRTKEFFIFDLNRAHLDSGSAKSIYSMAYDPLGFFKEERLKTCEDPHRKISLENQALSYQFFLTKGEAEEIAKSRQNVIWDILDKHYEQLPEKSAETPDDKTWRMFLARMDRRKMNITVENKDGQEFYRFNPLIDPELRDHSQAVQKRYSEAMKYMPLHLWSQNRFEGSSDVEKYPRYEDNIDLVTSHTKEVVEQLETEDGEETEFGLYYRSVPAYACAVLLRDYFEQLSPEDKVFCKDVILKCSYTPYSKSMGFQSGEGLEAVIGTLPLIIKEFPDDSSLVKGILLFMLFNSHPVTVGEKISDYAVSAVSQQMWQDAREDANAIFNGYLFLKPKLDAITNKIRIENREKGVFDSSRGSVIERLNVDYADEISRVTSNQISYDDITDIAEIDPGTLITAFDLLPSESPDDTHKSFLSDIIPVLINAFRNDEVERRHRYLPKYKFFRKFAYFVLRSPIDEIESRINPLLDFISESRNARDVSGLLREFIFAEDSLNQYEKFWKIWELIYPKIVEICGDKYDLDYSKEVVYTFLLSVEWKTGIREWRSLREREKTFFRRLAEEIGDNSAVLYGLSKLLNDVGNSFLPDGFEWISNLIRKAPGLIDEELEVNTEYYLENLIRGYIFRNRQEVKSNHRLKNQILVILDFLIERGSVAAYLVREDIL